MPINEGIHKKTSFYTQSYTMQFAQIVNISAFWKFIFPRRVYLQFSFVACPNIKMSEG